MSVLPAIVEVGIGLVLIFLTLSAICSSLAEIISNLLNLRSRYLRQGIVTLLSDPSELETHLKGALQAGAFVADVLSNPRLQKLDPLRKENKLAQWLRARISPLATSLAPVVPPDLFSSVVVEQLRKRSPNYGMRLMALRMKLKTFAEEVVQTAEGAASPLPPLIIQALNQRDARQALEDIKQALPLIADENVRLAIANLLNLWEFEQVRQGICSLPPSRPREILLSLLDETQDEGRKLEQFQQQVAAWFDSGMDQVSQWYKQHINVFLRVLAVGICLVLNADVGRIVDGLWRDPTLRAALVAEAQAAGQTSGVAKSAAVDGQAQNVALSFEWQLSEVSRLPLGWNCDELNGIVRQGYETIAAAGVSGVEPGLCEEIVRPVGDGRLETFYIYGGDFNLPNLALKLLGLGVMSLGVSLGANFWYKLLKQLLVLRNSK